MTFEFFSWYLFVKVMDHIFLIGESDTIAVEEIQRTWGSTMTENEC